MKNPEKKSFPRFAFGENWKQFLKLVDEEKISTAENSLKVLTGLTNLENKRFLDIGSGSGLFSLAARNLGANVYSFDFDDDSVACTNTLKNRFWPGDDSWIIEQASVLDDDYLRSLGKFDVVYSWGVLHHTGDMWTALANVLSLVDKGGLLAIAIYNDQGWLSKYWLGIKRLYNAAIINRYLLIALFAPYFGSRRLVRNILYPRLKDKRGMDFWRDMLDWLGGYPFEVASPEQIVSFFNNRSFILIKANTVGSRLGCNEFVFQNTDSD